MVDVWDRGCHCHPAFGVGHVCNFIEFLRWQFLACMFLIGATGGHFSSGDIGVCFSVETWIS